MMHNCEIEDIINSGLCVGCGSCTIKDNSYKIELNKYKYYQAVRSTSGDNTNNSDVCPFSNSSKKNIDISNELFKNSKFKSEKIGNYNKIDILSVKNNDIRMKGGSSGFATWVAVKLLEKKQIDGVIHVRNGTSNLFEYSISTSIDEITSGSKSKYYHVKLDQVIKDALKQGGRYLFIGVPCYIKAIRLLIEKYPDIRDAIKFTLGIFCGHMKSQAFSELYSHQAGFGSKFSKIDFRIKENTESADKYKVEIKSGNEKRIMDNFSLIGSHWGLGLLKIPACEYCDDISSELSDVSMGDAWLPKYTKDTKGTNIVVWRSSNLFEILKEDYEREININESNENELLLSQNGNYRHRRIGLSERIKLRDKNKYTPNFLRTDNENITNIGLYNYREKICIESHERFLNAVNSNDLQSFYIWAEKALDKHNDFYRPFWKKIAFRMLKIIKLR